MGVCVTKNTIHNRYTHNPDVSYSIDENDLIESIVTPRSVLDRLLGCAYGQALGDAYGLATEFETREQVADTYPDPSVLIPFPTYHLTRHSQRWRQGDWTDDTDQWILVLETVLDHQSDVKIFAKKLRRWIDEGFPELGDSVGMGLGAHVHQVVCTHNFLKQPLESSQLVWEQSGYFSAANGAVMRCSAVAFVHYNNIEMVKSSTIQMCLATHADPRCLASCLAVCLAIARVIQRSTIDGQIEELIARVQTETLEIVTARYSNFDQNEFLWYTDAQRTLEDLQLDENEKIGYTYKCLASGFYGLRSHHSFEETLNALIRYGGDADTNGAVCGTMYGARYGYHVLPRAWLRAMPFKKWFDRKIKRSIEKMDVKTA